MCTSSPEKNNFSQYSGWEPIKYMKEAKVISMHENGNYHSISILSPYSNILRKLLLIYTIQPFGINPRQHFQHSCIWIYRIINKEIPLISKRCPKLLTPILLYSRIFPLMEGKPQTLRNITTR